MNDLAESSTVRARPSGARRTDLRLASSDGFLAGNNTVAASAFTG